MWNDKTGSLLPAACFVGVSLVGCHRQAAVALMTIGTMFVAGTYCGFLTNHLDIAPNYAGTLMALTNTVATIPGFIVPAFVGQLTHGNVKKFELYVSIVDPIFLIIFNSANFRPVANYFLYYGGCLYSRVHCLRNACIWRRTTME